MESISMNKKVVIHIIRSVKKTSMPWNDLYATSRKLYPGISYYPICISKLLKSPEIVMTNCQSSKRKFIDSGLFNVFYLFFNLSLRLKNRNLIWHIHNPSLSLLGPFIRIFFRNSRIIFNLHNKYQGFNYYQKYILKYSLPFFHKVIGVSKYIIKNSPNYDHTNKYKFIRNGIYSKYLNKKYPINSISSINRENTIVVVARLVKQKNLEFLLKVFANLKYSGKIFIYGSGVLENKLKEISEELKIRNQVNFMGIVKREIILRKMSESSIYISTSLWEGIGVANLEAAAQGCYPFLSNIGPHNEIANLIGLNTYNLDSVEEWSLAIDKWIKENDEYKTNKIKKISTATRQIFDIDNSVKKYFEEYSDI
tara:strand:- start:4255 stop:5355 length:1101 start_codon:yes stop_codon:yes gene_type:complete